MDEDDVIPGSIIPGGEVRGDFENFADTVKILEYLAAGFNPYGPSGTANQEFRTVRAYLQNIYGPLPEGAVDYKASDLNGDKTNEVYAVDANGDPHTIYSYGDNNEVVATSYEDFLKQGEDGTDGGLGELDPTADIRQILKDNGYSDEAIEEIFKAEVNSTTGSGLFEGNNVLSNVLCEIGYSNCSDWSVQPINPNGTPCTSDEGAGTYQNGDCVADTSEGTVCYETVDGQRTEGKRGPNGECIPLAGTGIDDDCKIITQENADECGYEISSDGQLIPKDLSGDPNSYTTYVNCGGGIFAETEADCPEIEGTGGYSEEEQSTAEAIKNWIEGKIGEVKDMTVDDVLEAVFGGSGGYTCELTGEGEEPWDCAGTDGSEGNQCWKDCVSASVLGGIPGLPMPPGAVDIGTVRDLENTANEIGTTIGGILNPDPDDEGFIEKVKNWVIGKIDDVFGGIDDVTLGDITGWITRTLGNVLGGLILIETGDATNTVKEKIDEIIFGITDDGTEDSRCRDEEGNLTPWGERNPASCGEPVTFEESDLFGTGGLDSTVGCDEGTLDEKNNCICPDGEPEDQDGKCGSTTVDTEDTGDTERDPRCSNPAFAERNLSLCGGSTTFTESSGFGQVADDDCPEGTVVTSENAEVCGKIDCGGGVFVDKGEECPTTEDPDDTDGPDDSKCPEGTIITSENAEDCGYKECNGFYIPEEQECTVETDKCINGEEPDPQKGCPEDWCDDAMTIAPDEDGQCPSDPPLVECPDGSMVTSLDQCGTTTYTCPDPNATTNEDGSCGTCKTGYVYDGSVERCVQSTTPDPCLDAAYAAANPEQCGTGNDCVDCTCAEYAAANPEECATGPETPSGGGGGGGGGSTGGSGMFDLESFEIAGDPQLLARMEFPIENFLQQYIDGPDNQDISITGLFEGLV